MVVHRDNDPTADLTADSINDGSFKPFGLNQS